MMLLALGRSPFLMSACAGPALMGFSFPVAGLKLKLSEMIPILMPAPVKLPLPPRALAD